MRNLVTSILAVFLVGCDSTVAKAGNQTVTPLTADQFLEKFDSIDGEHVVVRGYLTTIVPDLAIFSEYPLSDQGAVVYVDDETINIRGYSDLAEYLDAQGCTEKIVQIEGVAGMLRFRGYPGIVTIQSVHSVNDEGEVSSSACFSR